jgi:hypothetical protein
MPKPNKSWKSALVRRELAERAERIVKAGVGYRSFSELLNDALRRRLEELETIYGFAKAPAMRPAGAYAEQEAPIGGMSPASTGEKIERGGIGG